MIFSCLLLRTSISSSANGLLWAIIVFDCSWTMCLLWTRMRPCIVLSNIIARNCMSRMSSVSRGARWLSSFLFLSNSDLTLSYNDAR
jgi:hypothetical protein